MGRYFCQKKQTRITIDKANSYCLLERCPELMIQKTILERDRLKKIIVPVVPVEMTELRQGC